MDIVLVFPKSTFLIDPMVYPPLGMWYLAAQLERQGHRTHFIDLSVDKFPKDGDYDQLWVSATSPQMHEVRQLSQIVRGWNRTKTVLGGPAVWADPQLGEELHFDLVVSGEADKPDVVEMIVQRVEWGSSGALKVPTARKLDWVVPPLRRWDHKYKAYLEDRNGDRHRTTTLFTSRGCPMSCAFCESGRNGVIWSKFVRYEPVDVVENQIREAVERGHTGLMYYDDILPLNKPRTLRILELHRKYKVIWRCFLRSDVLARQGGKAYLKEMADAGLVEVLAGVESADDRIKNNIHKGTVIHDDTQALLWCKELGVKFKASLILGLPGETRESMERTREWILKYRPDRVDVNTLIPFPGTPITRHADDYDYYTVTSIPEEYWYKGPRDHSQSVVGTSALTPEEIQEFRDNLITEIEEEGIPY